MNSPWQPACVFRHSINLSLHVLTCDDYGLEKDNYDFSVVDKIGYTSLHIK